MDCNLIILHIATDDLNNNLNRFESTLGDGIFVCIFQGGSYLIYLIKSIVSYR